MSGRGKDAMQGLSKEEKRARALEMLKAKPRPKTTDAPPARDLSPKPPKSPRERAVKPEPAPVKAKQEEVRPEPAPREDPSLDALKRELEERARELEERARELEERERRLQPEKSPKEPSRPQPTRREPVTEAGDTAEVLALEPVVTNVNERPPEPETKPKPRLRAAPTGSLLEITEMNVHYGKIQALRGIDIAIQRGEVIALLGANGAGKSSTLRAISGMVAPSAGDIIFEGTSIAGLKAHQVVKYGIAHVPEGRELFPQLTVEENLRFGFWPLRKTGPKFSNALDRVYAMFPRLRERRSQAAGTMSGGEQQMLVFGRALMSSPKLLLVDEMSLGLAPLIVQILFDAIKTINAEGASVVIVEQFVHLALKNSDRAYVLAKGEVVLEAKSEKLENDPNLLAAYLGGAEGHIEEDDGGGKVPAEKGAPAKGAAKAPTKGPGRAAAKSGAKTSSSRNQPPRSGGKPRK